MEARSLFPLAAMRFDPEHSERINHVAADGGGGDSKLVVLLEPVEKGIIFVDRVCFSLSSV